MHFYALKVPNQDAVHQHAMAVVNLDVNVTTDLFVVMTASASDLKNVGPMSNVHLASITTNAQIFVTNFIVVQILGVVFHCKRCAFNL